MTAFNIDRFTTSGAPDPAFGIGGVITATFPQTTVGTHPLRAKRRDFARLSSALRVVSCTEVRQAGRMFMHCCAWGERPLLPR
jgi:hypothetical protein